MRMERCWHVHAEQVASNGTSHLLSSHGCYLLFIDDDGCPHKHQNDLWVMVSHCNASLTYDAFGVFSIVKNIATTPKFAALLLKEYQHRFFSKDRFVH